jgi:hypothetical protein
MTHAHQFCVYAVYMKEKIMMMYIQSCYFPSNEEVDESVCRFAVEFGMRSLNIRDIQIFHAIGRCNYWIDDLANYSKSPN